ncbi:Phosphoethanolamine transferase for glucans (OPG), alkaline phosphatase superfamily [Duganella sp. CF517]|uniref:phosphoethanolamine transferase n=1 Tax=Duganella sp. CF517 TaxID=1881038 RepID=UPI0008D7C860|nr:phosphoethanolamine transferase [Duganella sp. CF517]SEO46863.1 Phosphoethanolamine transferase for glucans (OPG), alkaline phosphatase superfamily [Duganella sp. CF517]
MRRLFSVPSPTPLLRPAPLFVLASYLLLSLVPCVPLLLGRQVPDLGRVLAAEALAWVAAWAVFQRPAWFHWLLLPALLALPTEMYLFMYYGQGISTHHLGIIAESSPKEAMEFLGNKVWPMALVLLAVLGWWLAIQLAARRSPALAWRGKSRSIALAILIVLGGLAANGRSPLSLNDFASSWPLGLPARGLDFYKERQYLARLGERSSAFRFQARQPQANERPEIVIMVLGESSRYDRWGVNGYARDTTPLLRQEPNLVALSDVITAVSATRLSIPVIISRKPAMQSLKEGFSEKSFLTAYKEAGFKTWWLSNQISFGEFDTPVSVFAKEADVIQFMNLGGYKSRSNLDQILLDPLRHAIADPAPKKLIVLHTLGSHWNYGQRYPKEFDKWQPSLYGVDKPAHTDIKIKPEMNNSYDNSILYTDWFLAQVIGQLKDTAQLTSMMYVADHGQTLYDGSCNLAFHGHNTQHEFHVPALVWYSDEYRERYPDKVKQLLRHRKARLATENIFHTLLDLGDIQYGDERLEWSFISKRFKPHKRYVDSYGWSNYDNASFKGDCREVIDKGKPLKQEK